MNIMFHYFKKLKKNKLIQKNYFFYNVLEHRVSIFSLQLKRSNNDFLIFGGSYEKNDAIFCSSFVFFSYGKSEYEYSSLCRSFM